MNNTQLALRFFEGATKGKGSNMFIEGDTIYSYGYHFKIAVRYNGYCLFNSKSYSHSTSKHQSYVRGYLPSDLIIECPDCEINDAPDYILNQINKYQGLQDRARKSNYEYQINYYKAMFDRVINLLKL